MHPVLSIGFYLLVQLIILLLLRWCLKRNPVFPRNKTALRFPGGFLFAVYLVLCLIPVAGTLMPDSRFRFLLQGTGDIFFGFLFYFDGIFFILSIILLITDLLLHRRKKGIRQIAVFVFSLAAGAGLMIYGMVHAQQTEIAVYDVAGEETGEIRRDLKIVLISDLHLGVNARISTTRKMVDMINGQDADAVVIAGDLFNSSYESLKDPRLYSEALRNIEAKYGVYAVYGNHDVEETLFVGFPISPVSEAFRSEEMEQFAEDCGFTVLYDDMVTIADGTVQIVGRIDGEKAGDGTAYRKSPSELLAGIDPGKYTIILEHEPVEFEALKENGADLALCGHTHAGQIFPGNLIVPFFNENAYGYKNISGLDTIVSSGVGYYGPPMRVGTNSEITVVNIHL